MVIPIGILQYMLAMTAVQSINHLLTRGATEKAHQQRERFHAEHLNIEERRLRLQEAQSANAANAQTHEFQHRERLQRLAQSHDHDLRNWPLSTSPSDFADLGASRLDTPVIAFIPPKINDPFPGCQEIAPRCEDWIRQILDKGYGANDPSRPITFLGGGWQKESCRSEAALEMLYRRAPETPIAVLQLDYFDRKLHLLIGCSGFGPRGNRALPMMSKGGEAALWENSAEAARQEAQKLQEVVVAIQANKTVDLAAIRSLSVNLALLELEKQQGKLPDHFIQVNPLHLQEGTRAVGPALQIAAAGLADFFHWTRRGTVPLLPSLLPAIAANFPAQMSADLTTQTLDQYEAPYCFQADRYPGMDSAIRLLRLAKGFSSPDIMSIRPAAAARISDAAIAHFLSAQNAPRGMTIWIAGPKPAIWISLWRNS
jgi:hypothetical protein